MNSYFEERLSWLKSNGCSITLVMFTTTCSYYTAEYEYNDDSYLKVLFTSNLKVVDSFGNDFIFDKFFGDFDILK